MAKDNGNLGENMNDDLGKRMKDQYEHRTRFMLPRRTYTIIRLDGKAFHSFTKGFKRPFDHTLMSMMDKTTVELCKQIQGVALAYTQSDEISLILTDFTNIKTEAWFDGNIQKMASISASIATAAFNREILENADLQHVNCTVSLEDVKFAHFDSRVFTVPDLQEVFNYLIWRQQDATRNSIQMVAQSLYSPKELHGQGCDKLQELIFQKGINWNDYTSGEKRGRAIVRCEYEIGNPPGEMTKRHMWVSYNGGTQHETPIFTQDKEFLMSRIPRLSY